MARIPGLLTCSLSPYPSLIWFLVFLCGLLELIEHVTAVAFDEDGEFVAVGDRSGRIMLYESDGPSGTGASQDSKGSSRSKLPEYRFYTEFQSHEPEFDYLKSLEIEEKINKITFAKRHNSPLFFLNTNYKKKDE